MRAIALASNDRAALNAWQQCIDSLQNVRLSGRQGKVVGLPMASTVASFLVPKLLGYAQWPDRLVFCPCAVLMRPRECRIDHGPFIVRILNHGLEHALPHTRTGPIGSGANGADE